MCIIQNTAALKMSIYNAAGCMLTPQTRGVKRMGARHKITGFQAAAKFSQYFNPPFSNPPQNIANTNMEFRGGACPRPVLGDRKGRPSALRTCS